MSFPPQKFGRYYVYDKLAVGGMAEIYKARLCGAADFQKTLIIKKLNVGKQDRTYLTQLFIDEAHLCASLNHPNIVQTYDFSDLEGHYFIAMEYVEGQDLKQLLIRAAQQRKMLSIDCTLFLIHELCAALYYMHSKKTPQGKPMELVHRDISPANILLSYKGEVKLADFGIAKNTYRLFKSDSGVRKGKHEYMSPEQASSQKLDHRSDIFCVGIILYELLTGRRLFQASSDGEAIHKVQECKIPQASSINPRISPRLNQVIHTALQKNPALRYQDAEQFRKAIFESMHPQTLFGARQELIQLINTSFVNEKKEEYEEEKEVRFRLLSLEKTRLSAERTANKEIENNLLEDNVPSTKINEELLNNSSQNIIPWLLCACFFLLWLTAIL